MDIKDQKETWSGFAKLATIAGIFIVLILTLFSFLIIPESPKDSEILCKKYHSNEACHVW